MQKIIIDTNIIVSALISRQGIPAKIIDELVLKDKVIVCLSEAILLEYNNVLQRDKFIKIKDFKPNTDIIINYLSEFASFFEPIKTIDVIKDSDDNKFLELAAIANADFIITGNTNDFKLDEFEGTKIVTPTEYWHQYNPDNSFSIS